MKNSYMRLAAATLLTVSAMATVSAQGFGGMLAAKSSGGAKVDSEAPRFAAPMRAGETPATTPGMPQSVTANFPNGSLTGTIEFDVPSTLRDGSPGVGEVSYFIKSYGDYTTILAEGSCEYGSHCVVPMSFDAPVYHAFIVYLKNVKGQSSPAPSFSGLPTFVGPGTPKAPANVALTMAGGNFSLSWSPVTECTQMGNPYIDPANVKYNVFRMPGEVEVAHNILATTFTEAVPPSTGVIGFSYKVQAEFMGNLSATTLSNAVTVGTVTPAWSADLATREGFDCFTVIDGNADGNTWEFDAYGFTQVDIYNNWDAKENPKDEWLVSPQLNLEAGKMYEISFGVSSYNERYTEKFEIMAGTAPTKDALTTTVVAPTDVTTASKDDPRILKGYFTAPSTGTYYVALHAMTASKTYDCFARSFSIGAGIESRTPAGVSNLSVTSNPDDGVKAVISFTAPALTTGGEQLTALSRIDIARDGEVIKSFASPAPGASLTYTDESATEDYHTYTVTPYNSVGAGKPEERTVFVGDNRPYPPYSCGFGAWIELAPFTIIDGDGDGRKWDVYSEEIRCEANPDGSNDLIILPALWLTEGHRYKFSVDVRSEYNGEIDPFEIVFGTEPTLKGMNRVLLDEPTPAGGYDYTTYTVQVDITESGLYYFGLRYKCAEGLNHILADNVSVNEGMSTSAPDRIGNLTVTPDFGGELKAVIAFNAPSADLAGNALQGKLSKIVVERDGQAVHTFTDVTPGAALTYTDAAPRGYHDYKVTSYNGIWGESAETRVYVGANIPQVPASASVEETDPGMVKISWIAPELDVDNNQLNPALVTYSVFRGSLYGAAPALVAEGLTGTSYTYQAVPEGEQDFVYYYVYAVTTGGASERAASTDAIPVGTPDALPYRESFAGGSFTHAFCSERVLTDYPCDWTAYNDQQISNLDPQDGDNGVLAFYAPYGVAVGRLLTGKIDLGASENPHFSIWYYARQDCTCSVAVEIREVGSEEFITLKEVVCDDSEGNHHVGWVKVNADLSEYKGKLVQLAVKATADQHAYMMFDNIRISGLTDYDLSAQSISAPAAMNTGEASEIKVQYENSGAIAAPAGSYSIELYRNGEKVQTLVGEAIAPDEVRSVIFTETPGVTFPTELLYHAEITMASDGYPADNSTDPAEVTLRMPVFPVVNDLSATSANGVNTLAWSAPVITVTPAEAVTDNFEAYPAFEKKNLGEWLLVDGDRESFGGFGNISLPGINGPLSFFVIDTSFEGMPNDPMGYLTSHSGTKYMASGWCDGVTKASDDWMISPRLSLTSRTVKFFAKSYDATLPESIQVMASSTTRDIAEFTQVLDIPSVPSDWTEYTVTLPEGTRFFAIRCNSTDKFMLFVDDVTYTPLTATSDNLQIVGYNVWRNGQKLTAAPVAAPGYDDSQADMDAEARYVVTAVYDQGESAPSNEAVVFTSALDGIGSEGISVAVEGSNVVVTGAQGRTVTLYSADGRVIASVEGAVRTVIPAPQGVALVTAGSFTAKVVVR